MRRSLFVLYSLMVSLNMLAQERLMFQGEVFDEMQKTKVDSVMVEVLATEDSSVVASGLCLSRGVGTYTIGNIPPAERYILRFSNPAYFTKCQEVKIYHTGKTMVWIKPVFIRRRPIIRSLPVAEKRASQVRMVVGKDTITYNAAAFQMAEGSMLDALIRQLPGVRLDGSRILVNGEYVESLLVNGSDFFRGDPAIALENLPAYMVSKIKVFRKTPDDARSVAPGEQLPLAMDVRLKKQFSMGWIANLDVGIGSGDHYQGRLFALQWTPHSRLGLFGNLNNTNDASRPDSESAFKNDYVYEGQSQRQKSGATWTLEVPKQRIKINLDAVAEHKDIKREEATRTVAFLPSGDVFGCLRHQGRDHTTSVKASGQAIWRPNFYGDLSFFRFEPQVNLRHYHNVSHNRSLLLDEDPTEAYRGAAIDSIFLGTGSATLHRHLIHRLQNDILDEGRVLQTSGELYASPGLPLGHHLIRLTSHYHYKNATHRQYNRYDLRYASPTASAANLFHHYYTDQPQSSYDFDATLRYQGHPTWDGGSLLYGLDYTFAQAYDGADRNRFMLERLQDFGPTAALPLGMLPSLRDSLQLCVDAANSYHSTLLSRTHTAMPRLTWELVTSRKKDNPRHIYLAAELPVRLASERLNYARASLVTQKRRHRALFEPKLSLSGYGHRLSYQLLHQMPQMTYLLDVRDDANPLFVSLGNANLATTHEHRLTWQYTKQDWETNRMTNASLDYCVIEHAIAMSRLYDRATSVTTYRPQNVDGNWSLTGRVDHSRPIDKAGNLSLTHATTGSFYNSVDLVQTTGRDERARSDVGTLQVDETIRLDYKRKHSTLSGRVGLNWVSQNSSRDDFTDVSYCQWLAGLDGTCLLPWGLKLSGDFTYMARRGYNDASMNTDMWLLNTRLSRTLMHGRLTLMADGFNLLSGLKDIRRSVNAQGRTETRYNVMPRYAMLHLLYRTTIKKNKGKNP